MKSSKKRILSMSSEKISKLFPSGTVIVAYKGKSIGGAKVMPQWKVEPMISETRHFRPENGILADLKVENSISMEFEAADPQQLNTPCKFDNLPGELTFVPLDPGEKVVYCFPAAELKAEPEIKKNFNVLWKFEIFPDNSGTFMRKIKANS